MSFDKYNASILVLVYNKEIKNSVTLSTLAKSNLYFNNCKLIIWNNGPKNIKLEKYQDFINKGFDVSVIETVDNESLAVIYNKFIALYKSNKYVLLDDDSTLNDSYLNNLLNASSEYLTVPIITMNGKVQGPEVNGYIFDKQDSMISSQKVMAIGSGLIIGNQFVNKILKKYKTVFDERFYLYGVDSTFFHRLNRLDLGRKVKIIEGFEHSLSRLESEVEKTSKFRNIERSYDFGLTVRYYSKNNFEFIYRFLRTNIIWTLKKIFKIHTPLTIKGFNYACIIGKHYRHSKQKNIIIHD